MSSQEQFVSAAAPPPRKDPSDCPQCNRRMTVKQVSPVLFASDIDEVVLGCGDCGAEVKRTVKRV